MPKNKKKITSAELSKQLALIGRKCSQGTIRTYWQEGAPKDSAENFLLWLETHHPKKNDNATIAAKRLEKLDQEIKVLKQAEVRAKRRNEREAGMLIPFSAVEFAIARGMSIMFAQMDRIFETELPPSLKGLDESQILVCCRTANEKFKKVFKDELQKLSDQEGNENQKQISK